MLVVLNRHGGFLWDDWSCTGNSYNIKINEVKVKFLIYNNGKGNTYNPDGGVK